MHIFYVGGKIGLTLTEEQMDIRESM